MIEPFEALLTKIRETLECLREPPKEWNNLWSIGPLMKVEEVSRDVQSILLNPHISVPGTAAVLDREPHKMDPRARDRFLSAGELFAAASLLRQTLISSYHDEMCDEPRADMERWSAALWYNVLDAIEEFRSTSILFRQNVEANEF